MKQRRLKKAQIRRVVIYTRVSTAEQAEKDLSLPAQLEALRRYCQQHGYVVVAEYVEPGASGTDDNRPVFRRMMEEVLAPANDIDAVLVCYTSRFMRNTEKARYWKESLRRQGTRVIAIFQEVADDPMGRLFETILESFDQFESEMNGLRTAAAMRTNAKKGFFNGSQPPYGYKTQEVQSGSITRRRLVPNPDERDTHNEVLRAYIAEKGALTAASSLNLRGYRYRTARKGLEKGTPRFWTKDLVLAVVDETAAIGRYYWGKTDLVTGAPAAEEDWVPQDVEPIVDRELFEMARKVRLDRDPKKNPGRTPSSPLVLAGLVKCGKCGASYQLETSGKAGPAGEYRYRYYNCRSACRTGKEKCAGYRIPTAILERAVLEHLADRLFTGERCRKILEDIVEEVGLLRQQTSEQRHRLQSELDDTERRLRRWEEAFESGQMQEELGLERAAELRAKRDELRTTLAKVVPIRTPPPSLYSEASIAKFQDSLRSIFMAGDNALTKNYLRFLVEEIVLVDNQVKLVARPEAVGQMMAAAAAGHSPALSGDGRVLTCVVEWLPSADSNHGHGD